MSTPITGETAWPELQRTRRAIVVVDVVESVRLMQANEADVIDRWRRFVAEVRTEVLPKHGGRLVKSLGDGMLVEFQSVRGAVAGALEMQRRMTPYNLGRVESEAMFLRIGANVADVVTDELDVYGSGVNLAARVAGLAGPGEIVVTANVRDQLIFGLDADAQDLGECYVKHFAQPIRAYRVGQVGPHPVLGPDAASMMLQPAIAVVPFDGGVDHSRSIVGELIAEGVIAQLSLTAELQVISHLSCAALAGRVVEPRMIAEHLKANYLVSGTVHVLANRLVVSAELCETRNSAVVWAGRFQGDVSELVQAHSEVIDGIAAAVHDAILRREVQRARSQALPTLESYALLMGAINMMHRQSRSDFSRARSLLDHLNERHSRHATPRAWLAKWYAISAAQGWTADAHRGVVEARRQVDTALEFEPANGLAWAIKGLLHGYVDVDFAAAESAYREALGCNPNESLAWLYLATLQGWRGNAAPAVEAAEQALRLSPLDPMKYYFDSLAGAAMLGAGEYTRAIELSQRSIRSNRAHLSTFRVLAMAQALSGDLLSAQQTSAELLSADPQFTVSTFLRRSPWRVSPQAHQLGLALQAAGVPA